MLKDHLRAVPCLQRHPSRRLHRRGYYLRQRAHPGPTGIITGWEDDGGSNIDFEILVSVISSVHRLFIRRTDPDTLVLEWRDASILQKAEAITGDWTDILGATSPTI